MSQPPPYTLSFSFSDFSSQSPSAQQPGVRLDTQFRNISTTLTAVLANMALFQRDDGTIIAPAGAAATVAVGVTTTGAAGTPALVTNSGTTSNAILDFTLPGSSASGGVTSTQITTALGFTPYSAANPAGYLASITSVLVTNALTYTPTSVAGFTGAVTVAALKTGLALTKADVGLGSVDNTADAAKAVASAAVLTTARTINGVSFNGSAAITISAVDTATLRVPATRNVTTSGALSGGGSLSGDLTLTIAAASGTVPGTMAAADFTKLAGVAAGATANTGTVTSVATTVANGLVATVTGGTGAASIAISGSALTPATVAASGAVTGSNLSGTNTGDQATITGNAGTATKWATARTLSFTGDATGTGSVDGSSNVATALTMPASGVTAGTYGSATAHVIPTINAKGLVTAVTTAALGSMSVQDASAVAITGGTATLSGNTIDSGGIKITGSGATLILADRADASAAALFFLYVSGGKLFVFKNGTNVASIDGSGNARFAGTVTQSSTP